MGQMVGSLAEQYGCAGITAINTVKGLRLDPETGDYETIRVGRSPHGVT